MVDLYYEWCMSDPIWPNILGMSIVVMDICMHKSYHEHSQALSCAPWQSNMAMRKKLPSSWVISTWPCPILPSWNTRRCFFRSTEICSTSPPFATSLARQMRHKARWGWLVAESSLPLPWHLGEFLYPNTHTSSQTLGPSPVPKTVFLMALPPFSIKNWLSQASWRSSPATSVATASIQLKFAWPGSWAMPSFHQWCLVPQELDGL